MALNTVDINNASVNEAIRSNMAEVTAYTKGLMPSSGFIYRGGIQDNTNCDTLLLPGWYFNTTGNGTGNSNFPTAYGFLIVFNDSTNYSIQIHVSSSRAFAIRVRWGTTWQAWQTF